MTAQEIAVIISAITVSVSTVIAAVFAGVISLRQLPKIHDLTNSNLSQSKAMEVSLRAEITRLNSEALSKAEAREARRDGPPG